jgi:hypothetical protein
MIRSVSVLLAALTLSVGAHAAADQARPGQAGMAFVVVDSFEAQYNSGDGGWLNVSGVLEGEGDPSMVRFPANNLPSCERVLALSMEHPGRYVVSLNGSAGFSCVLKRVP